MEAKKQRLQELVNRLNEEQTVKEVARILAGNDISEAVLKHANEIRKNMKKS